MKSEIRNTGDGQRFLVVEYDPESCNWNECIKAAFERWGVPRTMPVIAVSAFTKSKIMSQVKHETLSGKGME